VLHEDEIRIYSGVYWEHRDIFFLQKSFFLHKKIDNIFRRPTNFRRPRHSAYCAYWIIRPCARPGRDRTVLSCLVWRCELSRPDSQTGAFMRGRTSPPGRHTPVQTRGPIYEISYDLSQDCRKFIVRSTCDSDFQRAESSLGNIVS